jgi:hypothetical protein
MIRKSVQRFSEKIMPNQKAKSAIGDATKSHCALKGAARAASPAADQDPRIRRRLASRNFSHPQTPLDLGC